MTEAVQGAQEPGVRVLNRALIIDDHPLFCDALALTLRAVAGIAEVDAVDRLDAALTRLDAGPLPDVVVLDLHLPDVTGLEGIIRLVACLGGRPVVVVSSMDDARMIAAAMQAGAAGFVPKHARREVFRAAFAALRAGQCYLPEGYVAPDTQTGNAREQALARLALLTRQQAKILQLICEGRLNKQIAYDLSIAETTVKAHVTAIMRKLGVQSRTQAVLIANEASFSSILPQEG